MQAFEGATRRNKRTGEVQVFSGGVWVTQGAPSGAPTPLIASRPKLPTPETPTQIAREERAGRNEARAIANDEENRRDRGVDRVLKLRDDFNADKTVQEYTIGIRQLGAALGRTPDTAGDLALVYDFAKAMDPGSVVREAEMGMAENTSPAIETLAAKAKKQFGMDGGGNLTPEGRARLIREIGTKVTSMNRAYTAVRGRYTKDATALGMDPQIVVGDHVGDAFMPQIKEYQARVGVSREDMPTTPGAGWRKDKSLAGTEAVYRQMLGGGKSAPDILDALAKRGVSVDAGLAQSIREQVEFRKRYPQAPLSSYNTSAIEQRWNPGISDVAAQVGGAVGLYANAATAGIPQLLAGNAGTDNINAMRANTGGLGTAAEIGGFVTGTLMGDKALRAASPFLGRLGQGALNNPGLRTAGVDTAMGAAYGANTNPEDRLGGALLGGGAAIAGNLAGRYVVAPAATRALDASRGMFGNRLRNVPQALPGGERMLTNQFMGGRGLDPQAVMGRLDEAASLNTPMSLADTDPALRQLGGSVARKSPDAFRMADETFRPRALGQGERAIAAINQNLAPVGNIRQITDDAVGRARTAAQPLYEAAYGATVPDTPALAGLLRTPAGQAALNRARVIAANEGRDPSQLGFALDESGNAILKQAQPELFGRQATAQTGVREAQNAYRRARRTSNGDVDGARDALMRSREELREANAALAARPMTGTVDTRPVYSTQTLDYVKRGLDDLLEEQRNPVTGALQLDEYGRSINRVRADLVNEIDRLNPSYRQAREAYGQIADQGSAAQLGYDLAGSSKTTPADVGTAFSRQRPESAPFFQQGYATSMADTVERHRLSGNPFNAIHGSTGQRAKLGQVFPQGAPTFGRIAGMEDDMARTATELLGGSQTAPRQAADAMFDANALSNGAFDFGVSAATGVPPVQLAAQGVRGLRQRFQNRMSEEQANQLAPILYNTDPAQTAAQLREMIELATRRRAYETSARKAGGMFGSSLAVPLSFSFGQ